MTGDGRLGRCARLAAARLGLAPRDFALVTGCPRSGTTAVVEWLAEHPRIAGVSETRILLACHAFMEQTLCFKNLIQERRALERRLRALAFEHYGRRAFVWRRTLVDKEPLEPTAFPRGGYGEFLQHSRELFPSLGLIFMVREPVATVWSMMNREWGVSLASGVPREMPMEECIATWRENARIIRLWRSRERTLVCRYEDLVRDPAAESERLLRFLALPGGAAFRPSDAARVGFDRDARRRILDATAVERAWFAY